ncbi:type II toxin-antitoxin system PemK/MazF family toxin [Bacillus sp. EB600]|uniref:type II toxin-antitoxin system PemK/MazF family toxin n=1 Tax=Bacillus sp. EB600 TaxID=2806345 RepID=UPI00210E8689|nr:type II toxin-antitoxin system PemK/MazF family toxin [Bacillus sp. EB600]MCQ6281075.1 type II toxin-antitoxin system PemK/MazF family toxin [Bacillus sp. EB600]
MPINTKRLLQLKTTNPTKIVSQEKDVANQLRYTLNDTSSILDNNLVKEVVPFIFWNDTWNKIGFFGLSKNHPVRAVSGKRYSRGRKVFVDFGLNAGRESSLPHPAIVIHNFKDLVLVAPTTSEDDGLLDKEIEKVIISVPKDGIVFPQDTIIELHQMRCVSKNRIINDLNCNVDQYIVPNDTVDELNKKMKTTVIPYGANLKQVIEAKLCYHYAPDIFHQNIHLNTVIEQLQKENEKMKKQILEFQSINK